MDKLFARQLAKATTESGDIDIAILSELVVDVYEQAERDRRRSDRSIALMAEELEEESKKHIEYLTRHDGLTDLPNRASFNDHLTGAIDDAAGTDRQVTVVFINLDRFKDVNELYGQAVGDGLLKIVGLRLKAAAGDAFVARLGGDDFSIVMSGAQPAGPNLLAKRLQTIADDPLDIDGKRLQIALSIGIAIHPIDGADAETLMINGNAALARAKVDGANSLCFFEAKMDNTLRERQTLQRDLASAIGQNRLSLVYQPQAGIDGTVTGFEALLRWSHPTRGPISPAVFIPIAEDTGMIISIGEWVLREACREAASWPNPMLIAVNLSPVQFHCGDLPGLVLSILLETGLAPHRLELEITEGVLIEDLSRGIDILRRLKALGVSIAMDDFGTGYSSLSYFQSFPFDKIKIDQTFVKQLGHNPQSQAIIRAVIGLAHGLDLPVLAEGVETADQLAFLRSERCDEIQGYLIGRPAPVENYASLVGRSPENRASA